MNDPNNKTSANSTEGESVESARMLNIINKLRFLMISCRIEARLSLDEACKLIQVDKKKSAHFFADSILRTLDEALGKPLVLRLPGEKSYSFDEKWLARLITSFRNKDHINIKFLLNSRVENLNKRSYIYFLVSGLSQDIDSL
jgi:hypothetical protein